ncbi:hypothetical protein BU24DRAFT_424392 [Aaosphaeria arxii CBS 175.79]|uniref:Restriction of telomere capping protein 4 n=1 Tax=Aaosphaeria arxii CBS 175.79 TaxID=1450172 RepID=A0A6A5XKI2_9PLEO|nr:uncharacterized protein BU24DRAFT_424392 [Aaosphaeria arxii CBS 175.79]KAF2013389.1 hypothetical protein BU24DRAFT_424392 [Aaosphaeria arxii CBS 175.79]
MPQLRRGAPRLLSQVNNKPHATTSDYHDGEAPVAMTSTVKTPKRLSDEEVNADPISSSDEDATPAFLQTRKPSPSPAPKPAPPAKSSKPPRAFNADQIQTKKGRTKRNAPLKVPPRGAHKKSSAEALKGGVEGGNESEDSSSQVSVGKRKAYDDEKDNPFKGMEFEVKKARLPQRSYTKNIHNPGPAAQKTYGGSAKKTYGKSTASAGSRYEDSMKHMAGITKALRQNEKGDDVSDISDFSMEDNVPPPPARGMKGAKDKDKENTTPPPKEVPINLLAHIGGPLDAPASPSFLESDPEEDEPSHSDNNSTFPAKRGTATRIRTGQSSEELKNIEQYLQDAPQMKSDDKCPLCDKPVEQEHYWKFFKGKQMSVRHQQMFCHEHQLREAQATYKESGYPSIDWAALPARIKQFRHKLLAILRDEQPSVFRDQHAERVAAGEDRSVRTLIQKDVTVGSPTGYYGSRGLRAMMETISTHLADELREQNEVDRVVSFGGFATFILKVLVPEVTTWLVMDDLECSKDAARECIKESANLGLIVHEEVEDEVSFMEDDDSD